MVGGGGGWGGGGGGGGRGGGVGRGGGRGGGGRGGGGVGGGRGVRGEVREGVSRVWRKWGRESRGRSFMNFSPLIKKVNHMNKGGFSLLSHIPLTIVFCTF